MFLFADEMILYIDKPQKNQDKWVMKMVWKETVHNFVNTLKKPVNLRVAFVTCELLS